MPLLLQDLLLLAFNSGDQRFLKGCLALGHKSKPIIRLYCKPPDCLIAVKVPSCIIIEYTFPFRKRQHADTSNLYFLHCSKTVSILPYCMHPSQQQLPSPFYLNRRLPWIYCHRRHCSPRVLPIVSPPIPYETDVH